MAESARFIDGYLPYLLIQAAFRMSAGFHKVLKRAGVRESEWRVLATLSGSAGMRMSELVRHVLIKQSTLSRTIDRMEQKSLVFRNPDPSDRRAQLLVLTPSGQALADELTEAARMHEDADLAHLAPDQRRSLLNMLSSLFPALDFAEIDRKGEKTPFRMRVRVK